MNKIPCFYCNFLKLDHQVCADLQVGNTISLNKTEDGKKKEKKKKKRKRRFPIKKSYSNHSIRIMAFTWIPSSMRRVHKPLISKAKEQTKAQKQAKYQPT